MKCLDNITNSMDMNSSRLREIAEDRGAWHAAVHGVAKELDVTQHLNNSDYNTGNKNHLFHSSQGLAL